MTSILTPDLWLGSQLARLAANLNLTFYPLDYVKPVTGDYYFRAGTLTQLSRNASYGGDPERSGMIVIQGFTRLTRTDLLRTLEPVVSALENQTEGPLTTAAVQLSPLGPDSHDSTLYRVDLTVPYTLYPR